MSQISHNNFNIFKLNCLKYQSLCDSFNVKELPTFKFFHLKNQEITTDLTFTYRDIPMKLEAFTHLLKENFNIKLNSTYLDEFTQKIKEMSPTSIVNQRLVSKERDIDVTLYLILNYSLMLPKTEDN